MTDEPKMDLGDLLKPFTPAALARAEHPDNTQLHFTSAVGKIRVVRRIAQALSSEYADEIEANRAQNVRKSLESLSGVLQRMITFDLQDGNAAQEHRQLDNEVNSIYTTWISEYRPLVRGSVPLGPTKTKLDALTSDAEGLLGQLQEAQERQQGLVDRAETLAGDLASASLSTYYDGQASAHRAAARRFLYGAGALAVVLAVIGTSLFLTIPDHKQEEWTNLVRDLSARLFVIGVGVFAINFCVRGYRANEHLRVTNEHKGNALKTFRLFQESVRDDPAARAVVTAELVKAVFAPDQTGFLDNVPDTTILDGQSALVSLLASQKSS